MDGFDQLPAWEQQTWIAQYGPQAAPYVWAQQAGLAPPAGAAFGALDQPTQNLFYGQYQGAAPSVWEQQAFQNQQAAAGPQFVPPPAGPNWGTSWFQPGGVATGMMANQAGTTGTPYGFGQINQGRGTIPINQDYLPFLQSQATGQRGGYIPGSGSYLGWQLDKPGLLATIGGTPNQLTTWGSGAPGDPAGVAGQPQTPEQWVQAPRLFSWEGNFSGAQGPIASLFGRSDTPSGISTDVLNAPEPYWRELYTQIANGRVTPSAAGWQFLQSVKGATPQQIGGQAPALAQSVGAGAGAPGVGGQPGAPGGAGAASGFGEGEYWNNQARLVANAAAEVAYQRSYYEWLARHGDETLAQTRAKDAATDAYQQATIAVQREQEARLERAQQQNVGVQAAQLMGQLRGPASAFAAARSLYGLGRVPGVPNAVAALAGQYEAPRFQGPQALPQASTLSTLAQQLGAAGTGAAGDMTTEAQQFAAALPAPNKVLGRQFASMSPATQQLSLAGYESLGYDPTDVLNTIKQASLPAFTAPAFGQVG